MAQETGQSAVDMKVLMKPIEMIPRFTEVGVPHPVKLLVIGLYSIVVLDGKTRVLQLSQL